MFLGVHSTVSTETCAGASRMTWSSPLAMCSSVSSSGPGTGLWAAAWWHWSSPWPHTAAPSCPSSSHSEMQPLAQLRRGTSAAVVRALRLGLGWGTWAFLQCPRRASPGRSAADPLLLLPSWAGLVQLVGLWVRSERQEEEKNSAPPAWTPCGGPVCGPPWGHRWTGHHRPETPALWWWWIPSDAPVNRAIKTFRDIHKVTESSISSLLLPWLWRLYFYSHERFKDKQGYSGLSPEHQSGWETAPGRWPSPHEAPVWGCPPPICRFHHKTAVGEQSILGPAELTPASPKREEGDRQ